MNDINKIPITFLLFTLTFINSCKASPNYSETLTPSPVTTFLATNTELFPPISPSTQILSPTPTPQLLINSTNSSYTPLSKNVLTETWTSYSNANKVNDLSLGKDGFLWAATDGGVVRWNPTNKSYIRFSVSDGLPSNLVNSILSAKNGHIWIGTIYGQISEYDGHQWKLYNFDEISERMAISDILQANDGTIWFATKGAGALSFDGIEWNFHLIDNGIASVAVWGIDEAPDGSLWFETFFPCCDWLDRRNLSDINDLVPGLSRYKDGKWSIHADEFGADVWINTYIGFVGADYWVSPCFGNICQYTPSGLIEHSLDNQDAISGDIIGNTEDNLWIIPFRQGVSHFDGDTWIHYDESDGLLDNSVWSAVLGSAGEIWFGTSKGISHYKNNEWSSYVTNDPESSFPVEHIHDIAFDSEDNPWISSFAGLFHFDGSNWINMDDILMTPPGTIYSLAITKENNIWSIIGDTPEGGVFSQKIYHYNGAEWKLFDYIKYSNDFQIAKDDTVWFINRSGVYSYNQGCLIPYTSFGFEPTELLLTNNGSPYLLSNTTDFFHQSLYMLKDGIWKIQYEGNISDIWLDPNDVVWISERESFVEEYTHKCTGQIISFIIEPHIVREIELPCLGFTGDYNSIVTSFDGSIWIPTWPQNGLYRVVGNVYSEYTIHNGLAGNSVIDIYVSPKGVLWFETDGGLSKLEITVD